MHYQLLATRFHVGDSVKPFGASIDQVGSVIAVWPAIGMVDISFPTGVRRFPVEELTMSDDPTDHLKYPILSRGPTVSVAGGPFPQESSDNNDSLLFSKIVQDPIMCRRIVLGHLLTRIK
jgi:hypothetical protein